MKICRSFIVLMKPVFIFMVFILFSVTIPINSSAQYTKLLDFNGATTGSYSDCALIFDGTFLYGTTVGGGTFGQGTVFKIKPNGTGYVALINFDITSNGSQPHGSLLFDGTFLYGMTSGGAGGATVFKIKTDGTGYARLLDFNVANGANPNGDLILVGSFLYGMTFNGGLNGLGTIFKIKTDGSEYFRLLDFDGVNGRYPKGSLISDGTFLYGMTKDGGANDLGKIFKIMPDGTGYTALFDFSATTGRNPHGSLLFDGMFLYGMTRNGGTNSQGTIFKIKPDGTGYNALINLDATTGASPYGSLISDGTFLFGMTYTGGTNALGTIFKIKPDGTVYGKLMDFTGPANGGYPMNSLLLIGSTLYGATEAGGTNNTGTLFKFVLPSPTIISFTPPSGPIGTTVIITGTNFSPIPANNEVRFNGVLTNASLSSDTSITTSVPSGATTGKITVTVSGNTATSASDFTVTTTATITFNTQPSNQIICEGNNATLSLAATGDTNLQYQWQIDNTGFTNLNNDLLYSGVNTTVLNITNASILLNGSIFRCLVYGDNSVSTASANATLNINTIPLAEITSNGVQLSASSGDNYQWYQNGSIVAGATNQNFDFNFLEYGLYVVDVTDNGCTSTSLPFEYLITGFEKNTEGLKVYPNPVEENLFVEFKPPYTIQVMGVTGNVIQNLNAQSIPSSLDFSSLAKGIYFLKIKNENQTQYLRIIKK